MHEDIDIRSFCSSTVHVICPVTYSSVPGFEIMVPNDKLAGITTAFRATAIYVIVLKLR